MASARWALQVLAASVVLATTSRASAFGGSAQELDQRGNFVVTNQANVGFEQSLNGPTNTSFTLAPALDYFIIPHLSLGGQVLLSHSGGGGSSSTTFGLVPQVGYDIPLDDTWSFWPRASLSFTTTSVSLPGGRSTSDDISLGIFTPFLVHPAEHFFFGLGPGFAAKLVGPGSNTAITIGFIIGGYFNS